VVRDELSGWLMSLNKQGREGDRPFYLESWNGYGSYTVDRIGRGTVHVPALCLSILGGIQPDKLEKMIMQSLSGNDDGLLQRFQLLVCPQIKKEWTNNDTPPNVSAEKAVTQLLEKLYDVHLSSIDDFIGIHFDSDAQQIFDRWREQLEILLRSNNIDNVSYESHIAKYRSLAPSLALIFQLVETGPTSCSVDKKNIQLAIKWCDFLQDHAKKIYQVSSREGNSAIKSFQKKILEGRVKDEDSVRSIIRNGWEYLSDIKQVEQALNFLEKHGWVRVIETGSAVGRRSKIIRLHPDLRKFSL
ncbi:MAG: DUF3987 domain-containing protein, partial [Gammaproteobacteria bacterium]|nr:DUF3987 domain-containing protein [Gammaproteobacteria bacterium]